MPHQLDYNAYTYLAITLSASSPFFMSPPALVARHPGLALDYVGQAGGLSDVHLYSIPKSELNGSSGDVERMVVQDLRGLDGVLYVQVQVPGQRIKRAAEDL